MYVNFHSSSLRPYKLRLTICVIIGYMNPDILPAGLRLRHMMGSDQILFDSERLSNSNLTPHEFANNRNIAGETKIIRTYIVGNERGDTIVVLPKEDFGSGIPEEHEGQAISKIDDQTLRKIFDNNKSSFALRGVTEFGESEVVEWVYALPLEVYLSGYWGLLSIEEVAEIGPRTVWGKAETSLGEAKVDSY